MAGSVDRPRAQGAIALVGQPAEREAKAAIPGHKSPLRGCRKAAQGPTRSQRARRGSQGGPPEASRAGSVPAQGCRCGTRVPVAPRAPARDGRRVREMVSGQSSVASGCALWPWLPDILLPQNSGMQRRAAKFRDDSVDRDMPLLSCRPRPLGREPVPRVTCDERGVPGPGSRIFCCAKFRDDSVFSCGRTYPRGWRAVL